MEAVVVIRVPIREPALSMMDEEIAEGFHHIPLQEDLRNLLCGIRCMLLLTQMDKANGTLLLALLLADLLTTFLLLPQNLITKHTHEVPHLPQAPCQLSLHRKMTVGGNEAVFSSFFSEPKL